MAKKPPEIIRFSAQVSQIRTTVDGGANVTFSLSGKEVKALTQLLEVRQQVDVMLEVAAVPVISKQIEVKNVKKDNLPKKRKQRYPYRD